MGSNPIWGIMYPQIRMIDPLDAELARLRGEKERREKQNEINKLREELGWQG